MDGWMVGRMTDDGMLEDKNHGMTCQSVSWQKERAGDLKAFGRFHSVSCLCSLSNHHMYNVSIPLFISKNLKHEVCGKYGRSLFFFSSFFSFFCQGMLSGHVIVSSLETREFGIWDWEWQPILQVLSGLYGQGDDVWQSCCSAGNMEFGYNLFGNTRFGMTKKVLRCLGSIISVMQDHGQQTVPSEVRRVETVQLLLVHQGKWNL